MPTWMSGRGLGAQCLGDRCQMLRVVPDDLLEFILECSQPGLAVDELDLVARLVMAFGEMHDGPATCGVDVLRKRERRRVIIERPRPGILIERPDHLLRLTDDSFDAVQENALRVGEMV